MEKCNHAFHYIEKLSLMYIAMRSINQFIELHWQVLITKYRVFFPNTLRARAPGIKYYLMDNGQRNPFVRFNGSSLNVRVVFPILRTTTHTHIQNIYNNNKFIIYILHSATLFR